MIICVCVVGLSSGSLSGDEQAPTVVPKATQEASPIRSSWQDLLDGVDTPQQWQERRKRIQDEFLYLIRDDQKPARPALRLEIHEAVDVEHLYTRKLISYNVEADERAHAYLAIPNSLGHKAPAVVVLHGTYKRGKDRSAGLIDNPDKAFLGHLARRGYIVIAPDHFVAGHRIPPEGPYETRRFYQKHPEWTAVGKFTYEHSIAIDVVQSLPEVDSERIGVLGHSLGGQGAYFLAAYDSRIKAAACNCSAPPFRHNPGVLHWSRDRWYIYFKPLREDLLAGRLPPVDMHHIIALIAPRAFLDLSALNDGDPMVQRQRILMNSEIMRVYELLDSPQNFAFYVHGSGHSVPYPSRQLMLSWMDVHLRPASETASRLVKESDG